MNSIERKTVPFEEVVANSWPLHKLMSKDPKDFIGSKSIKVRKMIWPILQKGIALRNPFKHEYLRKEKLPKDRTLIFTPNHGFYDDMVNSFVCTDKSAYTLFGNIDSVYRTTDRFPLYSTGLLPVNRDNKESRATSLPKCIYAGKQGANLRIFAEGMWCTSDNMLALDVFPGSYKAAIVLDGYVVPTCTITHQKKSISIVDKAIDFPTFTKNFIMEMYVEYISGKIKLSASEKMRKLQKDALEYLKETVVLKRNSLEKVYRDLQDYYENENDYRKQVKDNHSLYLQKRFSDYVAYNACLHHRNIMGLNRLEIMKDIKINQNDELYLSYVNPFEETTKEDYSIITKVLNNVLKQEENNEPLTIDNLYNNISQEMIGNNEIDLKNKLSQPRNLPTSEYLRNILMISHNALTKFNKEENEDKNILEKSLNEDELETYTMLKKLELKDLRNKWAKELVRLKAQAEFYYSEKEFYYAYENPYIDTPDQVFQINRDEQLKNTKTVTSLNNVTISKELWNQNNQKGRVKVNIPNTINYIK